MKTFSEFLEMLQLNERFVNLIQDQESKEKYKRDVWDILQKSYAEIGGIKGSGFSSMDDMLNILFWKLVVKNSEVQAVAMYKDKGGRKLVATGYKEGSEYGRLGVIGMAKDDLVRSYGEKSKGALGSLMKSVPWLILKEFMITPIKSNKIIPVKGLNKSEIPEDGVFAIEKYPQLIDYGYLRMIGDDWVFKVSMGTPGKRIK